MQIIEAIKELIDDANFDCSSGGFSLQAMDSSHVSLVYLFLRNDCFEHYRCDRNVSMGAFVCFWDIGGVSIDIVLVKRCWSVTSSGGGISMLNTLICK